MPHIFCVVYQFFYFNHEVSDVMCYFSDDSDVLTIYCLKQDVNYAVHYCLVTDGVAMLFNFVAVAYRLLYFPQKMLVYIYW